MPIRFQREEREKHFIREWRHYRNMTLSDLAEKVGVSVASISRLELRVQSYTQPMLEAIAEALHCTPADLISRDPNDPAQEVVDLVNQMNPAQRDQAVRILRALLDKD